MSLARLPRFAVNAFIAVALAVMAIDMLPQSPDALHMALNPWLVRIGLNQGMWNLFAPDPDRVNTRLRAEITYRDGEKREWRGPDWAKFSGWEKWVGHRRFEWYDHIVLQNNAGALESWCRYLARTERPDLPDADRGAEVRVIYQQAEIPSAELRPWPSIREPTKFDDGWVLTIEKFE
jgi:hypothetical protein